MTAPGSDAVFLVIGGIEQPLVPGERVPIAGDLDARLTLGQGDGPGKRVLAIELTRGAEAETGATISAIAHMRHMDHGAFAAVALPAGPGRYVMALPFAMPGEWEVDLRVETSAMHVSLPLALSVVR